MKNLFQQFVLFMTVLGLGLGILSVMAQDQEATEEAQVATLTSTTTYTPAFAPDIPPTGIPASVTMPASPTWTLTPTAGVSASMTVEIPTSVSASMTIEIPTSISSSLVSTVPGTIPATASAETVTPTPPVEVTEEAEVTEDVEITEAVEVTEVLSLPAPDVEISATSESGDVVINISGTAIPSPVSATASMEAISSTSVSPTAIASPTFVATATLGGMPLRYVQGIVVYQNRLESSKGIRVQIFAENMTLVGSTQTNEKGIYSVPVPSSMAYWLDVSADGYLGQRIFVPVDGNIPGLLLLAGDINQDGCIDSTDLSLLRVAIDTLNPLTDFNVDGITDISDLAILAGNYQGTCQLPESGATPPAVLAEVTPELTSEIQTSIESIASPTATEMIELPLEAISGTENIATEASTFNPTEAS